jgi:hypothetical protein
MQLLRQLAHSTNEVIFRGEKVVVDLTVFISKEEIHGLD